MYQAPWVPPSEVTPAGIRTQSVLPFNEYYLVAYLAARQDPEPNSIGAQSPKLAGNHENPLNFIDFQ